MHARWPAMRCKHWYIWRAACLTGNGMQPLLPSHGTCLLYLC